MATKKQIAVLWYLRGDMRAGFTYQPYGPFGPSYSLFNSPYNTVAYDRVRQQTEGLLGAVWVFGCLFTGSQRENLDGPIGFGLFVLLICAFYYFGVKAIAKPLVQVRTRLPFKAAFGEFVREVKPVTLWVSQFTCLGMASLALWMLRHLHYTVLAVALLYFYLAVFLGIAILCAWIFVTQGKPVTVRR